MDDEDEDDDDHDSNVCLWQTGRNHKRRQEAAAAAGGWIVVLNGQRLPCRSKQFAAEGEGGGYNIYKYSNTDLYICTGSHLIRETHT